MVVSRSYDISVDEIYSCCVFATLIMIHAFCNVVVFTVWAEESKNSRSQCGCILQFGCASVSIQTWFHGRMKFECPHMWMQVFKSTSIPLCTPRIYPFMAHPCRAVQQTKERLIGRWLWQKVRAFCDVLTATHHKITFVFTAGGIIGYSSHDDKVL